MIELSIEQIASEIGGKIIHGSNGMIGSVAKLEEAKKAVSVFSQIQNMKIHYILPKLQL